MNHVEKRRSGGIKFFSAFLAVSPLVNNIKGFFTTSLALDIFIFSAPIILLILLILRKIRISNSIPAIIFTIYALIRSNGSYTDVIIFAIAVIYITAAVSDFFDTALLFKIILFLSCLASLLVIAQTISYYFFGRYLQMVWLDICREDIKQSYSSLIINGISQDSSLFRPSAFFLEPSHFSEYSAVALGELLFSERKMKNRLFKTILITMGFICTTSGMGIILLIFEFVVFIIHNMKGKSFKRNILILSGCVIIAAGVTIALQKLEIFNLALQRLFGEVDGYNAISGRSNAWNIYILKMSGSKLLLGLGLAAKSDLLSVLNITGYVSLIYTLGLVGLFLFILMILSGMIKSCTRSVCLGLFYLVNGILSPTTVGVVLIFYLIIIYSGKIHYKAAKKTSIRPKQIAHSYIEVDPKLSVNG